MLRCFSCYVTRTLIRDAIDTRVVCRFYAICVIALRAAIYATEESRAAIMLTPLRLFADADASPPIFMIDAMPTITWHVR